MATKAGAGKTVNKGEGSEFYAFLYILGETKLPLVDKDLKETGRDVNFLKVLREDAIYEFTSGNRVAVYVDGATHYFDRSQAQEEAKKVFSLLVNPGSIPTNAPALSSALKLVCAKNSEPKVQINRTCPLRFNSRMCPFPNSSVSPSRVTSARIRQFSTPAETTQGSFTEF